MSVSSVSIHLTATPGLLRLLAIADSSAARLMKRGFTAATFDLLASGLDAKGERLPSMANAAASRLGLKPAHRAGSYVPSRVGRMVQANVVSTLRTLAERDISLQRLTETGELTASHPKVRAGIAAKLGRQAAAYLKDHPRRSPETLRLPIIQGAPIPGSRLILGAADKCLTTMKLSDTGASLTLCLRLPTVARPTSRKQWVEHEFHLPIPAHLQSRKIAKWHLPTITIHPTKPGIARFHLAYTEPNLPLRDPAEPITSVVGIDWSPVGLGVISHVHATPEGALTSAFEGHRYDDRGLGIKLSRLQQEGEFLTGKIARTGHLALGLEESSPLRADLEARIAGWKETRTLLGAKRARINREMAFHFAGWVTDYARMVGATSIGIEDLSTLEAGGIGRTNNNRVAQSARRRAVDATIHLGTRAGLEVIEVPARGTSSNCPDCAAKVTRTGGYHSARCKPCGLAGNRDQFATVNIGKRVITGQDGIKVDRASGRRRIRKALHTPVKRVRAAKHAPTPRRARHKRVRNSLAPVAVKTTKDISPALQASVWDTNQTPVTREMRSSTPNAPVLGSEGVS